ncbi:MAG TPA: hypothetical protein VFN23_05930 [Ktedonobacteraceae bacterium]|nr:hypothetical protein [Ktedonobacteraceae bacterium]
MFFIQSIEPTGYKKEEATQMNGMESQKILLEVGLTQAQIEQLSNYRRNYMEKERQEATSVQRHLEFMRWLVDNDRLTDN